MCRVVDESQACGCLQLPGHTASQQKLMILRVYDLRPAGLTGRRLHFKKVAGKPVRQYNQARC